MSISILEIEEFLSIDNEGCDLKHALFLPISGRKPAINWGF
ncbi:hypothetical protein IWQ47_001261 [Aquimarina sp. EL_43]|nr:MULTISPECIES: hypothetical protein [Aquimarina]MBG6129436.1 hypothetical protein [Aquimarina sp. EL_35]MBG6150501.1 hypothetical protein [Aquimarina sp. EL_32]MBG6168191.1 hypothetical protein [Aquimarina sp. EL_43]